MPILAPHAMEFISRSAEQTRRMGMRLGGLVKGGDVIALCGDLGSGKTTLMQGIACGWGSLDVVTSPTFVLVNVYQRPAGAEQAWNTDKLFHLDAYRLMGSPQQVLAQAIDLDLETMLATGALVVEWAERVQGALPLEMLKVNLTYIDDHQRDLIFTAVGAHHEKMLTALQSLTYGVS